MFNYYLDIIRANMGERKIAIWGAWNSGHKLSQELQENGIFPVAYLDSNQKDKYQNLPVFSPQEIDFSDYYVLVSVVPHRSIYMILEKLHLKEFKDYIYLGKETRLVAINGFRDILGNSIESAKTPTEEKQVVSFIGPGSRLIIGEGVNFGEGVEITIQNYSCLHIEKGCQISDNTKIIVKESSSFYLGPCSKIGANTEITVEKDSSCHFGQNSRIHNNSHIWLSDNGDIAIGDYTTFGQFLDMRSEQQTHIHIGKDCMFSYYIKIRADNGHTRFDLANQRRFIEKESIDIEDHVWCGMDSALFPGTYIGKGSIVGAKSLVNKKFPCNCQIIGSPARISRENVTWDRENNLEYSDWVHHGN